MGCGCLDYLKRKGTYENVKRLATAFSKGMGVDVVIVCRVDGTFDFVEADAPEREGLPVVELISPYL